MALTLLSNIAAAESIRIDASSTAAMTRAAAATISSPDAPLAQIGAALAYNLALSFPADAPSLDVSADAAGGWEDLLISALGALPSQTDGEVVARLLCTIGQLIIRFGDEALVIAISLDAGSTLDAQVVRGAQPGGAVWRPLVQEVRALLG